MAASFFVLSWFMVAIVWDTDSIRKELEAKLEERRKRDGRCVVEIEKTPALGIPEPGFCIIRTWTQYE